ncbi:hypothetical protein VTJ49DRAFT_5269 [Mycothermus thermophilus]|uniref:Heterokaryon incompatibility domain-containing protein n=1 Tax=Humicola insolens TaxID=85995 RepID=A0ABR3VKZ0_HUMIN
MKTVRVWVVDAAGRQVWLESMGLVYKLCFCISAPPGEGWESKLLPRKFRLLNVGGSDVNIIHLVEANGNAYACLSYCWGGSQPVTLTQSSYKRFLQGIPVRKVGQTIQDAVEVARQLGLGFLWVDALCIIQDCEQDKSIQLRQMSDIYRGPTVTIAAGDAVASTQGFLRRPGIATDNATGSALDNQDVPHEIPFQAGCTVLLYEDDDQYYRSWHRFRLYTRAWTLQEMLLSPRILFYTANEVLWLCKTMEDSPYEPRCKGSDEQMGFRTSAGFFCSSSDRLRAIEALAKTVSDLSGYRYVYGHWEPYLVESLAWFSMESGWDPFDVPSWSWASARGPVGYAWDAEPRVKPMAKLVGQLPKEPPDLEQMSAHVAQQAGYGSIELMGLLVSTMTLQKLIDRGTASVRYVPDRERSDETKLRIGRDAFLVVTDPLGSRQATFLELEFQGVLPRSQESAKEPKEIAIPRFKRTGFIWFWLFPGQDQFWSSCQEMAILLE